MKITLPLLQSSCFLYFAFFLFPLFASGSDAPPPPNVIIIFVDDMGYADIGAYGASDYATPQLDRMADEGVRFTDFYVAQPVCSASRTALLTGCYPNRLGIHGALGPKDKHGIHSDEITLAELFKSKGYATALFGKWHLGHLPQFLPTKHGFDTFYGIPYSNDMWPDHPTSPKAWPDLPTIEGDKPIGYNTDQSRFTSDFTKHTIEFIQKNSAAHNPFFIYLAHPMPHVPLFVSSEHKGDSNAGLYGDVIQEIDRSVGQVLAALKATGEDTNTLVLFASDNGPWLSYGNHAGSADPLREGKGTVFEGGVRVPFIARWPGTLPQGQTRTTPAMTIDLFPTLAELIHAELPSHPIDGKSIWPIITGESTKLAQEAYFFYYKVNELHALRSGNWKLHFPHSYRTMIGQEPGADGTPGDYDYTVQTGLELYDLANDIEEQHDVSKEHPEIIAQLVKIANAKRLELGDALNDIKGTDSREPGRVSE